MDAVAYTERGNAVRRERLHVALLGSTGPVRTSNVPIACPSVAPGAGLVLVLELELVPVVLCQDLGAGYCSLSMGVVAYQRQRQWHSSSRYSWPQDQ